MFHEANLELGSLIEMPLERLLDKLNGIKTQRAAYEAALWCAADPLSNLEEGCCSAASYTIT